MTNQTVEILLKARDFQRSFFGRKLTVNLRAANSTPEVASDVDPRDWPAERKGPSAPSDTAKLSFVSGALAIRNERTAA